MKRVMKQALAIPVLPFTLAEKNNHSFCVKLVTETTITAKQKAERAQKQLFVPSFQRSVTSFAVTIAIWKKAYADKAVSGPSKRFIRYQKLLI